MIDIILNILNYYTRRINQNQILIVVLSEMQKYLNIRGGKLYIIYWKHFMYVHTNTHTQSNKNHQ